MRLRQSKGMAVVSVILISVMVLSFAVWFSHWTWTQSKGSVHQRSRQRALDYARSGLETAQQWLQTPSTSLGFSTHLSSASMPNGRFEYEITREKNSLTNFTISSTGFYGRNSEEARVESEVLVMTIDEPLVAVPGLLKISGGTFAGGMLYGGDVMFTEKPGVNTTLGSVYYSRTSKTEDGQQTDTPSYVIYLSSPARAQRLGYPPRFPSLKSTLRGYYRGRATGPLNVLTDGSGMDGLVSEPSGGQRVYFAEGDLHLGRATPFSPTGLFLVYVQGDLYIHKPVDIPPGSWVVFLVEKDIVLTSLIPARTLWMGTYMANGAIRYEGIEHPQGVLQFVGSLMAGGDLDIARGWSRSRTYHHDSIPDNRIPLPRFCVRKQYRITKGHY